MKKLVLLTLALLLCIPPFGCVKDENNNSASVSSTLTSEISSSNSGSYSVPVVSFISDNSDNSSSTGSASKSQAAGGSKSDATNDLLSQLEDLKKIIDSLDDISGEDLEIPTPNP